MYEKVVIGLLLLDCISITAAQALETTTDVSSHTKEQVKVTPYTELPTIATPEKELEEESSTGSQVPRDRGTGTKRQQLVHVFSETAIIVIIFGVMTGIIAIILLIAYIIGRLRQKRVHEEPPPFLEDEGAPLSSVETENPEI
ncbi:glycophorin-A isoform X1 [Rousettus aegyptiacus]|uniref:glycophorin-A isoform X1 n=1 Tax=Rousettus aegyptiacus TaxID=9407 RepID=UPI00168D2781|nr:glycophorin-A isoform X1 [Rousettus aegyptiacus]